MDQKHISDDIPLEVALDGLHANKIRQITRRGLKTARDLSYYMPRRYEDRSLVVPIGKLAAHIGGKVSVIGTLIRSKVDYGKDYVSISLADEKNNVISVTWFHQTYLYDRFANGQVWFVFGKLQYDQKWGYSILGPDYFSMDLENARSPMPVYSKIPGMSAEYLSDCIDRALKALEKAHFTDSIPSELRELLALDDELTYLRKLHRPASMEDVKACQHRTNAEILIPFAWEMARRKMELKSETDKSVLQYDALRVLEEFRSKLGFELTNDQERAVVQMTNCIVSGKRVNALVQGDVGCGKTVVAAALTAVMIDSGYQVAIMAPTVVLAEQHYKEFVNYFGADSVALLISGKMKAAERRTIKAAIKEGEKKVIVGTHAVFAADITYCNLGLTIVDEEHRFGVEQRAALRAKAADGAHSISMSATPIPRSLALTIYGDSTVIYDIHTMPKGRKPVRTFLTNRENSCFKSIYNELAAGHQGYVVCPLIVANENLEGVDSLEETFVKLTNYFTSCPEVRIAYIHGKMKTNEIQEIIDAFAEGQYNLLLSTTIVEVGVNVPNATVIAIKNAERFSLAQLHQLRGRVGRGKHQSYCVLLSEDRENARLQTMVETTDGFEIAKADLQQRGAGNLIGNAQSGMDRAVCAMISNPDLYQQIREYMEDVMCGVLRYHRIEAAIEQIDGRLQSGKI